MRNSIDDWDGPQHADPVSIERQLLPALAATIGWYLLPAFLFALWFLFFSRTTTGNGIHPKPELVLTAIGLGLLLTVPLRLYTAGWRPVTVGFAASVMSSGLATIIFVPQ